MPVYGSGGFTLVLATSASREQLGGWADEGIPRVKMKIGREPERDLAGSRRPGGDRADAELFVDANGAYDRKQALAWADAFADWA